MGQSMTKVLIVAICGLASMAVGGAVAIFSGIPMGVLSGLVVFLLFSQLDANLGRRRQAKAQAREIAGLKRAGLSFERALAEQRARLDEMAQAVEARVHEQSRRMVSELKVLEGLMREFATRVANKARAQTVEAAEAASEPLEAAPHAPEITLDTPALLETIRASLEENRVDLYLQPIVSLPQRKLRFYEALSRLRSEDGTVIMPAEYIKVAAPAGLMSVVDNLLLFRCVQIVRRLAQRQRDIAVFCNISGETLGDTEFFPQFLEYMQTHKDLARHIVFEFSQGAFLDAGASGEANLRFLSNLGFALSMDHVETLALDFARLKQLGFRYLKVRAVTLTHGMDGAQALVAAEDLKVLLARHGLNLVAERVEDEKTVVQLLDYGVDFAQGYLFGEPRALREETVRKIEKESADVVPLKRAG